MTFTERVIMQIVCEGYPRIDWVSQGFEFMQNRSDIVTEPALSTAASVTEHLWRSTPMKELN